MNSLKTKALPRRGFTTLALAACAACVPFPALAQAPAPAAWPTKPIKIVMPYAPGGSSDIITRLVAERMAARMGQPVIVETKPGASGIIGTDYVAKSAPDGYTLLMSNSAITSNPWLYKLPYNTERDLVPVTMMASAPNMLVTNPGVPVKNVKELIDYAKANPGKLSIGTSGPGQGSHLASELLKQTAGIEPLIVQYKGTGASLQDLLSGHVMASFGTLPGLVPHVKAGKLRAIAVASKERSVTLPDTPTIAETLPGFEMDTWFAIFAPGGTPAPIVDRLQKEVAAALADPALKQRVASDGYMAGGMPAAQFQDIVRKDLVRWQKVVKDGNIKVE